MNRPGYVICPSCLEDTSGMKLRQPGEQFPIVVCSWCDTRIDWNWLFLCGHPRIKSNSYLQKRSETGRPVLECLECKRARARERKRRLKAVA